MFRHQFVTAKQLAIFAKRFRKRAGKTRAEAARDLKVSQTSIFQAEERAEQGLVKLRMRMIEIYSPYTVEGPVFRLTKRKKTVGGARP